jgi:hypothetical protein
MSNLGDNLSDVADVEMHDTQENGTISSSVKKRTSPIYKLFTFGKDGRWHCKQCRQEFIIY